MAKCNCAVVMRWLLFLFLLVGFIFSAVAAASCSFMDYAGGVSTGGGRHLADSDADGVEDNADAFPTDPTEDTDTDKDGVGDNADAFPTDPTEDTDTDSDGVGDNADALPTDPTEDTDTDADGVGDNADAFPTDPTEDTDTDKDGVGDNADPTPGTADKDADTSDNDDAEETAEQEEDPMTGSQAAATDYGATGETGLYRHTNPDDGQCYQYEDGQTFDKSEEAARAGAAIGPMCAAAAAFFLMLEGLFCHVPFMKGFVGLILLIGIICQGLTFLMLASGTFCDVNTVGDFYYEVRDKKPCTVSQGGVYSAFALLFYFFALVILMCAPKPDPVCGRKSGIEKDSDRSTSNFHNEHQHDAWTATDVGSMT